MKNLKNNDEEFYGSFLLKEFKEQKNSTSKL